MKSLMAIAVAAVCAVFGVSAAWAGIVYVGIENAADDAAHGASADKPYASIKYAVESIQPEGGTVYIAKGTYSWNAADVNSYMITLTNATKIIGSTGKASDVIIKPPTTTSCRGVCLKHADAGIRFLTIRDCYLKNQNGTAGGGVYMTAGTVEDCIVSNCTGGHWSSSGSGIYLCGGRVSRTIVRDCAIANNTVYGCGIYANQGNSIVEDCLITGNTCYSAGAIRASGKATVVNCTVVANSGTSDSGIWAAGYRGSDTKWNYVYPVVVNCAIYNNEVSSDSTGHGGVWIADSATSFKYCASLDGITGSVEPVTGNADFKDLVGGDYRINSTSCCLDAGVDPIEYARTYSTDYTPSATDLDGNPRTVGKVDIGCYENQKNEVECTIEVTSDTLLTPVDVALTATASGASGTVSYDWLVSNRVTAATTAIAAGSASETVWANATPGYYDVYLTLTDDNGEHPFSSLQAIKLSPPHLYLATNKTAGVTPAYPYDSPAKAAFWLTEAVEVAEAGATIHVAAGEYKINYSNRGWRITKGITVLGADPVNPAATWFRDTVGSQIGSDYGSRPLFINHADALVAHMAFTNGSLDNDHGGCVKMGVYGGCVSNCVIRNGSVRNNDIIGCGAFAEGGLITHCVITNNYLGDSRPGKVCGIGLGVRGTGKASNCLIAYNYPNYTGGFAASADGNGVIENCTIVANRITDAYATVRVSGSAQVRNCAIAGNTLTSSGDIAPHVWTNLTTAAEHFVNCGSDGDEPINDTCRVAPAAKLFVDYSAADYTPAKCSVLKGHGATPTILPSVDLAGNPRVFGRKIDIGAFESQVPGPGIKFILR